jgi:hypothetical protein
MQRRRRKAGPPICRGSAWHIVAHLAAAAGCPGAAAAAQKPRKTAAGAVDVSRETIISGEKWTIWCGIGRHRWAMPKTIPHHLPPHQGASFLLSPRLRERKGPAPQP